MAVSFDIWQRVTREISNNGQFRPYVSRGTDVLCRYTRHVKYSNTFFGVFNTFGIQMTQSVLNIFFCFFVFVFETKILFWSYRNINNNNRCAWIYKIFRRLTFERLSVPASRYRRAFIPIFSIINYFIIIIRRRSVNNIVLLSSCVMMAARDMAEPPRHIRFIFSNI